MQQLQLFYDKILKDENDKKILSKTIKNALNDSVPFSQANEELKSARDKARLAKDAVLDGYKKETERLESIKLNLKANKELLSDKALVILSKKGSIENIEASDGFIYEPNILVKFKKNKKAKLCKTLKKSKN